MKNGVCSGVILVDVLFSVYILSMGLVPLAGLFTQISRSGTHAGHQEMAVNLAQDKLEMMHSRGSVGWQAGTLMAMAGTEIVACGGQEFVRTTRVALRSDLDSAGHLLEAEVSVSWAERGQECRTLLVTYFAVGTELERL